MYSTKDALAAGLGKLQVVADEINVLETSIEEMTPKLAEKNAELKVAMSEVNADKSDVGGYETVVAREAEVVNKKA